MKSAMECNLGVFLVVEIVIDAWFSIERGGWFLIGWEWSLRWRSFRKFVINFLEGMKSAMECNLGVFLLAEIVIDAQFSIEGGGWFLICDENEV